MSESGRSAIPTDRPSSIQKPMPSSVVRSSSETATSAPIPAGTATRAPVMARALTVHSVREASVDIYLAAQLDPMTHLWVLAIVGKRGSRDRDEKLGAMVVPGGKAKISASISCRCMYHATACV